MRIKHYTGVEVDVPEAKAQRLTAGGSWTYVDKTVKAPETPAEAPKDEPEGSHTPEPVQEPTEASEAQEDTNEEVEPSEDGGTAPAPTLEDIRAWARKERPDLNVKEKGRVSRAATEAYREAHQN